MQGAGWTFSDNYNFNGWRSGTMNEVGAHSGGIGNNPAGWTEIAIVGKVVARIDYGSGWNGQVDILKNGQSQEHIISVCASRVITLGFDDGEVLRVQEGLNGHPACCASTPSP
mmetsp:Transcript_23987/g.66206  ORF Transcript_23987/g.66206 Transcript_23987/m.66206 type:complete len:113 (-) Transcript_23987:1352-1690(-)